VSLKKSISVAIFGAALVIAADTAGAQGDPKRGEKIFEECRACHTIEKGSNGVGPSLSGVFGRRAAELDDFRYSPAFKRANITWSRQTMDAFLADPQKAVPANRMPYAGMPEAKDRADVIEFMLRTLK
jgi:cytochrome c